MHVLTRKEKEVIEITIPTGEIIRVSVNQIRGNQCSIGIVAPDEYKISRPKNDHLKVPASVH